MFTPQEVLDKEAFCAQVIACQETMFRTAKAILRQGEGLLPRPLFQHLIKLIHVAPHFSSSRRRSRARPRDSRVFTAASLIPSTCPISRTESPS